ncbi:hypothetical protein VTO73DRAFT_4376 [Trametes versicolor]
MDRTDDPRCSILFLSPPMTPLWALCVIWLWFLLLLPVFFPPLVLGVHIDIVIVMFSFSLPPKFLPRRSSFCHAAFPVRCIARAASSSSPVLSSSSSPRSPSSRCTARRSRSPHHYIHTFPPSLPPCHISVPHLLKLFANHIYPLRLRPASPFLSFSSSPTPVYPISPFAVLAPSSRNLICMYYDPRCSSSVSIAVRYSASAHVFRGRGMS